MLVLKYVEDEEMKKTWYHDILRDNIREFVSILICRILEKMIDRTHGWSFKRIISPLIFR